MATFFFDLDGTLTDSRAGLFAGFRAGLAEVAAPAPPDAALQAYLGTPLPILFAELCPGISQAEIERGIAAFRADYEQNGLLGNVLYPGIATMLRTLRGAGHRLWIVTSKPQTHAERAASSLGLDPFVEGIVGAGLAETDTKTDLVARALAESGADREETTMLGDRAYDVIGAVENRVMPVGALWGYGTRAELFGAGCRQFVRSASEFQELQKQALKKEAA